jgi:plastocyanin
MRLILTLCCVAALAAACGSKPEGPASTGGGRKVDAATTGSVSGRMAFDGPAPAPEPLKMTSDPACAEASGPNPMNDAVLVSNGALQNVFVYVKEGLDPGYSFDVPTTALKFDQRGCRYLPRVFGVRAGQPIDVLNDDNTLHNVHALPKTNREFNHSMGTKGEKRTYTFAEPEVMVRFKCDVHNWMTAHVGVMAHPYFAVSKADGTFEIAGLPPGSYTIEAWHERFGAQTQKVTITDRQSQSVAFTFSAKS